MCSIKNSQVINKITDNDPNSISFIDFNEAISMLYTNEWKGLFETNNPTTALNIFNKYILDKLESCTVSKSNTQKNKRRLKPKRTQQTIN